MGLCVAHGWQQNESRAVIHLEDMALIPFRD